MDLDESTMPSTLGEALIRRARITPDRVAYTFAGAQLTFAQLADRASGRAAALQRLGVGAGERVAIAMSVGLPFLEIFWASQLIGAVPCAFNPAVPGPTQRRRIARVRPTLTITDESADELRSVSTVAEPPEISPQELAFMQLTSGTAGEPRAAMITHANVTAFLRGSDRDEHVRPDDVLVSWMPPWHDFGLVRFVLTSPWSGVTCHLLPPAIWSIPEWLSTISRVRATLTGGPDTAYRLATRIVKPDHVDLSSLREAWSGGEPVRQSTIESFEERFSAPGILTPGYGLAEATLAVTAHRPGDERSTDGRGNVSNGRPMPGCELHAGSSIDAPDEILVRGDAVFAGYFEAREETAQVLRGGWLHTGDVGYLDADSRLFVLGRRSGMIKRLGSVVAPRELEEAAEQVEGVRLAAATGLPGDDRHGDRIVVAVEKRSDRYPDDRITAAVSARTSAAVGFAPSRVVILPSKTIPRTHNGKVRYPALRAILMAAI